MILSEVSSLTNEYSDQMSNSFSPSTYKKYSKNDIKFFNQQVHSLNKIIENSVKVQKKISQYLEMKNCTQDQKATNFNKKEKKYNSKHQTVSKHNNSKQHQAVLKLNQILLNKKQFLIKVFTQLELIDQNCLQLKKDQKHQISANQYQHQINSFQKILDIAQKKFNLKKLLSINSQSKKKSNEQSSKQFSSVSFQNSERKRSYFKNLLKDFPKLQKNIEIQYFFQGLSQSSQKKQQQKSKSNVKKSSKDLFNYSSQQQDSILLYELKQQSNHLQQKIIEQPLENLLIQDKKQPQLKVFDESDISFIAQSLQPQINTFQCLTSFENKVKYLNQERKLFKKQSSIIEQVPQPSSSQSSSDQYLSQNFSEMITSNYKSLKRSDNQYFPNIYFHNNIGFDKAKIVSSYSYVSDCLQSYETEQKQLEDEEYLPLSSLQKLNKNELIMQRMVKGVPIILSQEKRINRKKKHQQVKGKCQILPFKSINKENQSTLMNKNRF